jgi:alpha-N-arabinofuranosidase
LNRRDFLSSSLAAGVPFSILGPPLLCGAEAPAAEEPGVAVLLVDTGRPEGRIDSRIYGHFLEHINHSVEDGLFAEQIRGAGFEGDDFRTYWQPFSDRGTVSVAAVDFQNGRKSVRLDVSGGRAGIRQRRVYMEAGRKYDGSLWVQRQAGSPALTLRILGADGAQIASLPLPVSGSAPGWHEVPFSFASPVRDAQATVEIAASGTGALLVDFVSMMRADVRGDGMFRVDLLGALRDLRPTFIRWPGGSFASTYQWTEGIGRYAARGYHPNTFWGGYSDYYGFGTDEFLSLCRKLNAEPLIVLPAPGGQHDQVDYAMNWVHYLNDLSDTEWGRLRASNGHPEPYGVRFFQIDNEPMNNGFTPESYAALANLYGSRLREIAPEARIVACGQKRSNDMEWSEKVIDLAGDNFDILGCHNYEYEPDNFETGLRRIRDYLVKLRDYARASAHPAIEIAVLEWSLQHTYDWRAGLHTAGSLIMYEELSPVLGMTCPALLMRNTTDDSTWTSFIYHDHVSWFPGAGYVVEKLFREHFAEKRLASTTGVFRDIRDRTSFFDRVSSMKPEGWQPGAVDAIATASADGRRIVIKAVNYQAQANTLLVRLQGSAVPERASATLHTITAGLTDAASLGQPDAIAPVARSLNYAKDLTIELSPHSVAVVEIRKE